MSQHDPKSVTPSLLLFLHVIKRSFLHLTYTWQEFFVLRFVSLFLFCVLLNRFSSSHLPSYCQILRPDLQSSFDYYICLCIFTIWQIPSSVLYFNGMEGSLNCFTAPYTDVVENIPHYTIPTKEELVVMFLKCKSVKISYTISCLQ